MTLTTNETPPQAGPLELWCYEQSNLQVDSNLATAIQHLNDAAAAGYTTVLYADSKLEFIDLAIQHYLDNLAAYKAAADSVGIKIIPNIVSPGYANGLLLHDPNLIEGQPCKDVPFTVSGGQADAPTNPATQIVNGGFENHNGDSFPGWNQMDGPGISTFADAGRTGGTSIRFSNFPDGNAFGNDRIQQTITVDPWTCYSVNFWLKTDAAVPVSQLWGRIFSADPEFRQLTYNTFPISSTQGWTQYHLIFNSQEKTSVYLYLGIWSGVSGRFWVDDVDIENAGLINLIRRPGAPFKVTSEDGSVTYAEGADYAAVSDPLMGQVGYPGNYDLYHARPQISIPGGSPIQDGATLKLSYYHAAFTDDIKPACALAEPGVFDVITDVLTTIHSVLDPPGVFIGVDEHRVAGWSEPGFTAGTSSGQLLASFTAQVDAIAKGIDPDWTITTWSDMYDAGHNMVADYYLCRGGTQGAINGLPAGWDIANWHFFNDPAPALGAFSAHGNRQILSGYYDNPDFANQMANWLDAAKPYLNPQSGGRVFAAMYTTWQSDYGALDGFAQAVRNWEAAQ